MKMMYTLKLQKSIFRAAKKSYIPSCHGGLKTKGLTTIFLQWFCISIKPISQCVLPVMVCDPMMLLLCIFEKEK